MASLCFSSNPLFENQNQIVETPPATVNLFHNYLGVTIFVYSNSTVNSASVFVYDLFKRCKDS